ncbi:Cobalt-zinc-cadmium resistance protein CzcC precursor [Planctomycetes bacterium Pla163]|uniref:Cobalt-zinc-cadmium resistance protein CzcC n=1 Tax=Rohdeia mirabilis TaxID=2528008 RepID=A0A518CUM1_9BACT|nr:Cobalt-zinc-cadmium resistance protein CzcC precursor [Planctomycetes bacterium Pla163]
MPKLLTILFTPLLYASCVAPPEMYGERLASWERSNDTFATEPRGDIEFDEGAGPLEQILRSARSRNPGLEASFQRWRAALERVPQATTLPEPRLTLGVYLAEVETRVGPMQGRVGIAQPFPWFGKLELAGNASFEAAEAARELLEATRLELEYAIRDTWYEYAYLETAIEVTEGNRALLVHWESVARARFETGLGQHSDVIRAQVELGKIEDRVQTLTDLRRPLVAKLNAALDRDGSAELPRPTGALPVPPAIDGLGGTESLDATNPMLRAYEHRIAAARYGVGLADKEFFPDFTVGVDYTLIGSATNAGVPDSGEDAIAVTLGFELPVWRSSYRAGVREAEAIERAMTLERSQLRNRLAAELEMALYRFRDADRRLELFRDALVPKGEESVEALDSAYQSGDQGFLDLIDAQRILLEFQLQVARAESDRAQSAAEIERITGLPLHAH